MSRHTDFYVELFRTWHQSDKQYGIDGSLPVVIMEDPIIHTIEKPECDNPDCICHDEPEPMDDDYINLSARSVAETEPDESSHFRF